MVNVLLLVIQYGVWVLGWLAGFVRFLPAERQ